MIVQLTAPQRLLLLRLLDAEIAELGPEIHHTRTYKDPLIEQRQFLRELRDLLSDVPEPAAEAGKTPGDLAAV